MSRYSVTPIDLHQTKTYCLHDRPSKVRIEHLARPYSKGSSFSDWLQSLPDILAARDLKAVADAVVAARAAGRAVIVGIGGHVIKCGIAPILIDLIERDVVTAVGMNGSAAIHDFELCYSGFTSEDVDFSLGSGDFGMAEETGLMINAAAARAASQGIGLGEAIGTMLQEIDSDRKDRSLLAMAYNYSTPVTVHLAIGTDIIHMHRSAVGAHLGAATHTDFRLFCSLVRELSDGGVYLNIGSAVLMPEVFLKAVTVIRNLGLSLQNFTTVNCDFLQHYRPLTNVVRRPVAQTGRGYALTGHHELLIPLLAAAIIERLG